MPIDGKGPWDSADGDNGGGKPSAGNGENNPWDPESAEPKSAGGGKITSLEDLLRKRRGGGGKGGGLGKLPTVPGGRSIWSLAIVAFIVVWLVWTSIHRLEPAQSGVVTTFGKYSHTVGPGVSFTLPYPLQNLQKVDTGKVRTVTIGVPDSNAENLILTRDANVIDMAYNVRWLVTDPERFLFQLKGPDDAVREVAESAMRAAVANFDLIQAIGPGRGDIQEDVKKRMQVILDSYRAGISVQSIDIQQAAAPSQVSAAFRAVNVAKQQAESNKNEARKAARIVIERAKGETAEFDKIYVQYRAAPGVTRRRLYYETMEQVLAKTDKTIVESGNVTPYLPLPELKRRAAKAANDVQVEGKK